MKKFISFIVIILVLAGIQLGAMFYVSRDVEKKFRGVEDFLTENQFISAEVISYERGLYKSEAITQTKLKYLGIEQPIKIKHTIYTGPIIMGANDKSPVDFKLAIIKSEPLDLPPDLKLPFSTHTEFSYTGAIDSISKGDAFNLKSPQMQISGLSWASNSHMSGDWQALKADVVIPEVLYQGLGMMLTIKNTQLHFDQSRIEYGIWVGDASLKVGSIFQKEPLIDISDVFLNESSVLKDKAIDFTWDINFQKAVYITDAYGPINVKAHAFNIDPEALSAFSKVNFGGAEIPQDKYYQKLLLRSPKFSVDPSLVTIPQGKVNFNGELLIGGPDIGLPINWQKVESTLEARWYVMAPKPLVRNVLAIGLKKSLAEDPDYQKMNDTQKQQALEQQLDAKIQKLIQNGLLIDKGPAYEFKFTIEQGKWIANGKEVEHPLSEIGKSTQLKPGTSQGSPAAAPNAAPGKATSPAAGKVTSPAPVKATTPGAVPAQKPAPVPAVIPATKPSAVPAVTPATSTPPTVPPTVPATPTTQKAVQSN